MAKRIQAQSIAGTEGDDVLVAHPEGDLLRGLGGNDRLYGGPGYDILDGGAGNDQLFGADSADSLYGGTGDDLLYGEAGDDALRDNDGGNDRLWGGEGDDHLEIRREQHSGESLLMSGGVGNDVIDLWLRSGVVFTPTARAEIDAGDGDDHVQAWGQQMDATVTLGEGNDYLIIGGGGHHRISLGRGHDVIQLTSSGDGTARISDFTPGDDGDRIDLGRTLQMYGVSYEPGTNPFADPRVALLRQVGDDVEVFLGVRRAIILENVRLGDLTATNFSGYDPDGRASPSGGNFFGSSRSEQTWASYGDDRIQGLDGDDQVFALGGDDEVFGGAGNDRLDGGSGDDILHGGAGDDELSDAGQSIPGGNETYYGGAGDDRMSVSASTQAADWARLFGEDGDDSLGSRREVRDLWLDGGAGSDGMFVSNADHWRAEGGSGDDRLLIAGVLRGSEMFFGEGVFDGGAGHDVVGLGDNTGDLEILVVDEGTFRIGDSLFHNIEGFSFGSYMGGDVFRDLSHALRGLSLEASSDNDTLIGTAFDDILIGNFGRDTLDGGSGYDTAVIDADFAHAVITVQGDGSFVVDHALTPGASGPDTLRNIERLQFYDGWYTPDGTYIPAVVHGTDGDDEIAGKSWSDTLLAGAGDDLILRTDGDDVIDGGTGTDTFQLEHHSMFYRLMQIGDDFLLKGEYGNSVLLRGVEMIRFSDVVMDLHRMFAEPATFPIEPATFPAETPKGRDLLTPTDDFDGPRPGLRVGVGGPWMTDPRSQDVEIGPLTPARDDHFF